MNTTTDTVIKLDAAKDCLKSSELLVTRVDVALGLMSEIFCDDDVYYYIRWRLELDSVGISMATSLIFFAVQDMMCPLRLRAQNSCYHSPTAGE